MSSWLLRASRLALAASFLIAPLSTWAEPSIPEPELDETADFRSKLQASILRRAQALEAHISAPSAPSVDGIAEAIWWEAPSREGLLPGRSARALGLDDLLQRAIAHSTQIRVFADIPLVRETGIAEADGRFTPRFYGDLLYEYRNEPVGSLLTTGRSGRFRQQETAGEIGLRKRFVTGAEGSISQRFSHTRNNSEFFEPNPQAGSRLKIALVQPLLRGGGITYNKSLHNLAVIDTGVAREEYLRQVESHLVEVTRSYWTAYLARASYVQQQRLVRDTEELVAKLDARADLDSDRRQRLRSRAALEERRTDLVRSNIAIQNAISRLRALVNDPELESAGAVEVVPADAPLLDYGAVRLSDVLSHAVEHRPEVQQAYLQLEGAAVREQMARNENRYLLDAVVETAWNGLDDASYGFGPAFGEGADHTPSVLAGLRFEMPIGTDEARARLTRRRRELRQQENQVRTTLNTILLEAEVSVAEYASAVAELQGRMTSLVAARADRDYSHKRWESGIGGEAGNARLEFLLQAQERLADAEHRLVRSQVAHRVSITNLERVKGNFLQAESISVVEDRSDEEMPLLDLRME